MIDIVILLAINSAMCFGFWNACYFEVKKSVPKVGNTVDYKTETKEIKGALWFIEKWATNKWFHKPLCECVSCMASFHSIYPYWTYMYTSDALNINAILFYPIYILALSGLNYLIDRE